ncbi:Pinin/SDK/MemA protein [Trinorchestia longiramus]|nr:Pinin/SDK/MemA protein [Trinorchestia longiramus]
MSLKSKVSLSERVESEISKIQEDLVGVDESLRRLSGSFSSNTARQESRDTGGPRRNDEPPAKRVPPPGGVFARLGGVAEGGSERRSQFNGDSKPRRRSVMNAEITDTFEGPRIRRASARIEGTGARVRHERQTSQQYQSDGETPHDEHDEEIQGKNSLPKPAVASSISRAVGSQSRMEAATLVTADRASRDRNRRMFGALLGTLQSFRKDEAKQRDKDEQRMAVEKKLEKKGQEEQERMKREKRRLLEERRLKLLRVQQLADHAQRVQEHEKWAEYQMQLTNFIRTKAGPSIFWLPKSSSRVTNDLIEVTAHGIQEEVAARREQLEGELQDLTEGLTSKHQRHRHDELPHSDEEGDLEYKDGEAGRAVVRRGKGKDEGGSSVDRSVDARDMLLDSRRQRANGDAGNRKRLRSETDVMCSRMVVQVGSGDRVVEVLNNNERPAAERHRKDVAASSQVKSLKIKVERDNGPSEKESRKITIESSEKDNEKSKKRKLKENSYSNDIEDEVSMMRRRIVEKARRLVKEEKVGEVIQNGKAEENARRKRKDNLEAKQTTTTSNEGTSEVTKVGNDEPKDKKPSDKKNKIDKELDSSVTGQEENVEDDATLDEIGARLEGEDVFQVKVESEETGNGENEGEPASVDELQLTVDPKDSLMLEATIEKENVSSVVTPKVTKSKQEAAVTLEEDAKQTSSIHRRSSTSRSDREKRNRGDPVNESHSVTKKPRIDTTALKQDLLAITRSNQEKIDSRSRKAAQAIEANEKSVDKKKNYESIQKMPEKKEENTGKQSSNQGKEMEHPEPRFNETALTSNTQVVVENLDVERKNPSGVVKDLGVDPDGQQVVEQSKSSKKKSDKIKDGDKVPPAETVDPKKDVKISKRTSEESKVVDGCVKTNKVKGLEKKNKSLGLDGSFKNKASSDKERSRPKSKESGDSEKHSKTVVKVAGPKSEKKSHDKVEDSESSSGEDSSDSDSSSDTSSESVSSANSDEEERREISKTKKNSSGSRTVASGHSHQKGKHFDERSKSSSGNKKSTSRR